MKELVQGQGDSALTEEGIRQAKGLADELRHIKFDAIFSSDLLRARRTAAIIALERQLAVTTNHLIREQSFGRWEGKARAVFREENKQAFEKLSSLPDSGRWKYKIARDVESNDEVVSRAITFLREIAVTYIGKIILVVSHGALMRNLLVHFGFGTFDEMTGNTIGNAAYIKLRSDGVDFFIEETKGISKNLLDNKP